MTLSFSYLFMSYIQSIFTNLRRIPLLILAFLLISLGSVAPGSTQEKTEANPITSMSVQLDQIEATFSRKNLSDDKLNEMRNELLTIQSQAILQKDAIQPRLKESKARLATLTPEEKTDEATSSEETQALIEHRERLTKQVAELDGQVKLVTASLVRVEQLNNKITIARQDRFTSQLFERSESLLNPLLWVKGLAGLGTSWKAVSILFSDWFSFLSNKASDKIWQILGMITLASVVIIGPIRYALVSGISRLARLETPTPLQRSLHALWSIFVYTFVPFAGLAAIVLIMDNAELLPSRILALTHLLAGVVFVTALSYGLIRVLLAPQKPPYRLLNIATPDTVRMFGLAISLLAIFTIESLVDQTDSVLLIPLETTILIRAITAILIAVLIWIGLRMLMASKPAVPHRETDQITPVQGSFSLPGFLRILQPIVWLTCLVVLIAPLLGYVSLGGFLAEQLGRIFIILALLGILSALIDNLLSENLQQQSNKTQQFSRAMGIQAKTIGQFGVLLNGLMRILLYIAAALLIFAPWGVQSSDFLTSLRSAIFNIQIGDLSISPINIVGAILVFIVTLVLVKSFQRWVERRLMPATSLDTGLKNSIQTSVGYIGFILSAMLAFSYMGLDLSNIALVAGALSVGIGFGLQSIVNNFVSGLILLVERPIKTGDWVVVGADQGYVRKISVRATKIETFDRATVIVPNSDLISNRVMNWMHNGSMGRVIIPIGVSYDADPEIVRQILLDIANESEYVASYPGPSVYFMDFGASSLDFELRCYIQDINNSLSAKSALRFAIFKALKDASIEIPFPQQDIHIRSVSAPEKQDLMPENLTESTQKQTSIKPSSPAVMHSDEVDLSSGETSNGSMDTDGSSPGEGNAEN